MNIEELKQQLKEGTFYFHKFGLIISSKVNLILENSQNTLNISFNGGMVDVYMDKIKPVKRPSNIIEKFVWCYRLKNEWDEEIGYIGLKESK